MAGVKRGREGSRNRKRNRAEVYEVQMEQGLKKNKGVTRAEAEEGVSGAKMEAVKSLWKRS